MATDKNSFVLYTDHKELWETVTDEQAGKLIKHILKYVTDENPDAPDEMTKLLFLQFKQHLKRDLKKWEKYKEKQSLNGAKGGRPAKPKETQKTQPFKTEPKKAVNVNVNANVNENVNNTDDDVYVNITTNFERYIANDKLVKAVIDNNGFKSKSELEAKLQKFNKHLASLDQFSKTWKDYTSHFLNWNRAQKVNTKSPTDITL